MEILSGHISQETAYVVNDYPYGYTLRCKIRYWLEYAPKRGFRLCSQTTNPKRPGEVWNKAKASTYARFGNRKLKKVLSDAFFNHKVRVRGHRGTAYGWLTVNINAVPNSIEHRRRLEAKVWRLIDKNDIHIGSYGTPGDMGCDYGWGREIHINFAEPDFSIRDEGNIFLLNAQTEAGMQWAKDHLPSDAQTFGRNCTVVEHRYIADIVAGIKGDGLSVR